MKVAFYNQMCALDGSSLLANIAGHWAVHFRKVPKHALERTDLRRTLRIVERTNADILGLAEILKGQEDALRDALQALGYPFVFFGKGHRTAYGNQQISVAIASKISCVREQTTPFPVEHVMGGGGGFVSCHFPSLDLHLAVVHCASPRKNIHAQERKFLQKYVENKAGRMILMGDFNVRHEAIKDDFPNMELASGGVKTCSVTPLLRRFWHKDVDHVFTRNLPQGSCSTLQGNSDHRMIVVDIPNKPA